MSIAEKHWWSLDVHGTYRDELILKHIAIVIYKGNLAFASFYFTHDSFKTSTSLS